MDLKIKTLSPTDIKLLKKRFETFTFMHDFNLFYEHQVPNTALILLEGTIELKKKKTKRKLVEVIHPGLVLGVHHLIKNIPFKFNCLIKSNTKILLLPKSEILKIMNDKQSEIYQILSPVLEEGMSA